MGFKCQSCKEHIQGEASHKVVTQYTLSHHHASRGSQFRNHATGEKNPPANTFHRNGEVVDKNDPGGHGTQIKKEITVCKVCLEGGTKFFTNVKALTAAQQYNKRLNMERKNNEESRQAEEQMDDFEKLYGR